jgi:hypothetical protein
LDPIFQACKNFLAWAKLIVLYRTQQLGGTWAEPKPVDPIKFDFGALGGSRDIARNNLNSAIPWACEIRA